MYKFIVGLGNPGREYKNTRHNVGFLFLDYFLKEVQVRNINTQVYKSITKNKSKILSENTEVRMGDKRILLVKPQTYMNLSGQAVMYFIRMYKLDPKVDLIVIHDDLDIRLGEYKIQKGKGPRLHNGIESIETSLGFKDFLRFRIGIDNREAENRISGENYVLQKFQEEELNKIPMSSLYDELIKII